jgi:hypothetical protein
MTEHRKEYLRKYLSKYRKVYRDRDGKREEMKMKQRVYRANRNTPEKRKREYSKQKFRQYSLTAELYQLLVEKQHGCCAICGRPSSEQKLCIDHDHKSGVVRKLLCTQCNTMLGFCHDNPTVLRLAAIYLEEHGCE